MGHLSGKEAEPAGAVREPQARLGGACACRRTFRFGHAGEYAWGECATLCLLAWCQAEREAEFFVEDWGDGAGTDTGASALVEASKRAFRRWDARLTLAVWRTNPARATGPGVRIVKKSGVSQERGCPSPGDGGVRTSISFLEERVVCERNRVPGRTTTPAGGLSL